jgi:predicted  nucleic acid-binding Zn-ribbon protein
MARYICTTCGATYEADAGVCPDCGSEEFQLDPEAPRKIEEPPGEIAARAWPENDEWQEHSAEDVADYLDWKRQCIEDEQMVRS